MPARRRVGLSPSGEYNRPMPGEPDLIGQVRGHYRIDALVGEGAMGRVYRGWDTRLERPVALKALKQAGDPHAYD